MSRTHYLGVFPKSDYRHDRISAGAWVVQMVGLLLIAAMIPAAALLIVWILG